MSIWGGIKPKEDNYFSFNNSFTKLNKNNSSNTFASDYDFDKQKTSKKDNHTLNRVSRDWLDERKGGLKRIGFVNLGKDQKALLDNGEIKPFVMFSTENQSTMTLKWTRLVFKNYGMLAQAKQWRQQFQGDKNSEQYQHLLIDGRNIMADYNWHLLFSYFFNQNQHNFTYLRPLYFDREVRWLEFLSKYYAPRPYELVIGCRDLNCSVENCKGDGKNPHKHWNPYKKQWMFGWGDFNSTGITDLLMRDEYFGINCEFRPHGDFDKPKRSDYNTDEEHLKALEVWDKVVMPLIDFIVDDRKMTHLVKSRSDGRHTPFKVSRNVSVGKLKELWDVMTATFQKLSPVKNKKGIFKLGDPKGLNGENSFLVSGLCKDYEVLRTKHFNFKNDTKNTPIHFWNDKDVDNFIQKVKKRIQRLFLRNLNIRTPRLARKIKAKTENNHPLYPF